MPNLFGHNLVVSINSVFGVTSRASFHAASLPCPGIGPCRCGVLPLAWNTPFLIEEMLLPGNSRAVCSLKSVDPS